MELLAGILPEIYPLQRRAFNGALQTEMLKSPLFRIPEGAVVSKDCCITIYPYPFYYRVISTNGSVDRGQTALVSISNLIDELNEVQYSSGELGFQVLRLSNLFILRIQTDRP